MRSQKLLVSLCYSRVRTSSTPISSQYELDFNGENFSLLTGLFAMRDLDALLNSLANIDRNSLVAILSSEAEDAQRLVTSARRRTPSQRAKRHEAVERAARINRILSFFQHGDIAPDMPGGDITL